MTGLVTALKDSRTATASRLHLTFVGDRSEYCGSRLNTPFGAERKGSHDANKGQEVR